jgi:hypothetical protein
MKQFGLLLIGFMLTSSIFSRADEGMWLLPLLQKYNIESMQEMGLELSAEEIYSINSTSLKDAIVVFGRGCTGEVISNQGLVLTNHHCGYGVIQRHSNTENDYLKDGFWAMSKDEEIASPGLTVTFLVSIEDVTEKVCAQLSESLSENERSNAIEIIGDSISNRATEGTHYRASVRSFYGGNKFYLMVYEIFPDVRMVGAPPSSIGKFGADTDNWMWPRHTGDFSLFRIYADKDNKPAAYSPDNVPYTPKHHLPISLKGIEKGDYTMIMGYPGSTQRYMTSWEVDETENITNAHRALIRGKRQEILLEDMLASDEIRIKYASKYSSSTNYWKYSIGQNQALNNLKVRLNKEETQQKFTQWIMADQIRVEKFKEALPLINEALVERKDYVYANLYIQESILRSIEIISFASRAEDIYASLTGDDKNIENQISKFKQNARSFYKDYNAPTDQKVAKAMLKLYSEKVNPDFLPSIFHAIQQDFSNNISLFVDNLFSNSIFVDSLKLWNFLDNPSLEKLKTDPAFVTSLSVNEKTNAISEKLNEINQKYWKGHRLYVAGIMEQNEGNPTYPDANFTMRLTFGRVMDYNPRDAVEFNHFTTLKGVMEKEDPKNWEFVVPQKLKELYQANDFGQYAMENGEMPVAFISNNDITGGNSGSPIMNSKGQLIGCAFDGNWEAMSGDIVFEPEYQRCINVDIRYVLFIIEKFANAKHLVNELTIVKN